MKKNPIPTFALLCALTGLSNEALAQNNNQPASSAEYCTDANCVGGDDCEELYPLPAGSHYLRSPRTAQTCPADCRPTRQQCLNGLLICAPTRQDCEGAGFTPPAPSPTPPGPSSPPRPRPPHVQTRPPADICLTGAIRDPNNAESCVCEDGRLGPFAQYQPVVHHGVTRLQQRGSDGALRVMCVRDVQPPAQTDNGLDCGELSVCGDTCRDLQHDPNNCGSCGHACGQGELCNSGACIAREQAAPTPPVPATPNEGAQVIDRNIERRLAAVEARPQVMFGLHAATSLLRVSLPGEDAFTLVSPALGGNLRVNWPVGPGLTFELFGQIGWSNTGHICTAVTIEGGLRVGWAIGERRIVTPHVGWSGWWADVPCHPPAPGPTDTDRQVADGVAFATGPTVGLTVRIWDGFHIGGEFRWTPISRFTETWNRDFNGVAPLGGNIWLGYRFFGP